MTAFWDEWDLAESNLEAADISHLKFINGLNGATGDLPTATGLYSHNGAVGLIEVSSRGPTSCDDQVPDAAFTHLLRYHQARYRHGEHYQCKADQKGRLDFPYGIPVVMIRTWRIPPHATHPLESPHDLRCASLYTSTHHTLRPSLQTRIIWFTITQSLSHYLLLKERGLCHSPAI
jgi:hypothetical protein